jgi:MFS family permease
MGLAGRIYIPALLVQAGTGMLIPVLPLYLRSLDFAYTPVTTVIAAAGLGALVAELPTGALIARCSERTVMVVSVLILALSTIPLGLVGAVVALGALRFASGIGSAGWLLSRQTYLTRTVAPGVRGRALSVFGGVTRVAFLVGPLLGGVIVETAGFTAAFAVAGSVMAVGLVPLILSREPSSGHRSDRAPIRVVSVMRHHWRTLIGAGSGHMCIIAVRQGRLVLLPLIGESIGLGAGEIGLIIAVGLAADLALFPLAGWLMDTHGRLAAIVPAFSLVGLGLLLLPLAQSGSSLLAIGVLIGIGNGIGSGTMLTLGSDLAPEDATSQFLGALGLLRDTGRIIGPLLVGWLADAVGLGASAIALGILAFVAVGIFVKVVGETLRPAAAG